MNICKALSSFGTKYPFSVRSFYIAA